VPRVVSVVFNSGGRVYQFDAAGLELSAGDQVVVETARGTDFGKVVRDAEELDRAQVQGSLKKVVRKASTTDLEKVAADHATLHEAIMACRELVAELKIAMKPVCAESSFDGNKLVISFFAEERVDFRGLVGRLSERLNRRVELRQVTARDEARLIGGLGQCGRQLCCATFCGDQEPVSIRMAKDQNLPLNPSKISGACGRLMCCLKYEHKVYTSFKQRAPKRGAFVTTSAGKGKVIELLPPADSVRVDLGEGRTITCKLAELGEGKDES
jgi:cell fate regulator YaaT (PSP1 superfamily)